ncbi:MAG: HEPN domain-containing protein [Candidatus Thiodiazotropha sp. (ex Dulcina madagascariensis)]|nr:HEPN domain-containing protein [Candidatus Thiodiazotropha sp. (ex Dulcina madagascariensis)]
MPLAAFNLNQATESAYKAILLVFTGYCPHEHLLAWLGEEAAEFGLVFREIFPDDTERVQERFTLLDRAYIGARYKKDFIVFWGDVDYLAPRVNGCPAKLRLFTRRMISLLFCLETLSIAGLFNLADKIAFI